DQGEYCLEATPRSFHAGGSGPSTTARSASSRSLVSRPRIVTGSSTETSSDCSRSYNSPHYANSHACHCGGGGVSGLRGCAGGSRQRAPGRPSGATATAAARPADGDAAPGGGPGPAQRTRAHDG